MTEARVVSTTTARGVDSAAGRRRGRSPTGAQALASKLADASRGDVDAFAELFDATAPRVYGLARRTLKTQAQAEEVAQDSYLEIWRTSSRFDPDRGNALTWMLTIVHRRAVDRIRAEEARIRREANYHDAELPLRASGHDPTHQAVLTRADADRVRRAIALLAAPQRRAVELTYFEGCTQSEVASRTGVPLGTAKSRLRAGTARLRNLLADELSWHADVSGP